MEESERKECNGDSIHLAWRWKRVKRRERREERCNGDSIHLAVEMEESEEKRDVMDIRFI
jgi:hypothetical protein